MKRKKAQVTIYIFWFLAAVLLLVMAALLAPFGILFTTEMYSAGEGILAQANESISLIQNDTVRGLLDANVNNAREATTTNVDILSDIYQYGWVIVLVLSAIVAFLYTRTLIEFNSGSGGFVG